MTFSTAHILATAAITGLAAAAAAWWKLRRWPEVAAVFVISGGHDAAPLGISCNHGFLEPRAGVPACR